MVDNLRVAILSAFCGLILSLPASGAAQETALRGLRNVGLYVPSVQGTGSTPAPDSQRLADVVELKLRREGIAVVRGSLNVPYIKLEVVCAEGAVYPVLACSLGLTLRDMVTVRAGATVTFADLWNRGRVVLVEKRLLSTALERYTAEIADDLVSDWLRENPKPDSADSEIGIVRGRWMPPNTQLPQTLAVGAHVVRHARVY